MRTLLLGASAGIPHGRSKLHPLAGTHPQKLRAPSAWDLPQRLLDVVLVIAASPVWVPLLLLIMVVKLVMDGRPVLFHHVRLGLNGEPF